MLSYMAGRDGAKGPNLFEKGVLFVDSITVIEVGSWLMMATELVPGMTPQIGATFPTTLDSGINACSLSIQSFLSILLRRYQITLKLV